MKKLLGFLMIVVAGFVTMSAFDYALDPLLEPYYEQYFKEFAEMQKSMPAVAFFLLTAIFLPILEELFFRGLILRLLARWWKRRVVWAIVLSGAIFGAAHSPIILQVVSATFTGVVLGYVYLITRTIWAPILIHVVNNSIAFSSDLSEFTYLRDEVGNDFLYWTLCVVCLATAVVGAAFLHNKLRKKTLNEKVSANEASL